MEPAPLPHDRHHHHAAATLFLTDRCNLLCTYCHAEDGEFEAREMAPEVYRAAIDLLRRFVSSLSHTARRAWPAGPEED